MRINPSLLRPADAIFAIIMGGCQVTQSGLCVQSGNFPNIYPSDEHCHISVRFGSTIFATAFDVDSLGLINDIDEGDILSIDGIAYQGSLQPAGIFTASEVRWFSSSYVSRMGWQLCSTNITTTSTTTWQLGRSIDARSQTA